MSDDFFDHFTPFWTIKWNQVGQKVTSETKKYNNEEFRLSTQVSANPKYKLRINLEAIHPSKSFTLSYKIGPEGNMREETTKFTKEKTKTAIFFNFTPKEDVKIVFNIENLVYESHENESSISKTNSSTKIDKKPTTASSKTKTTMGMPSQSLALPSIMPMPSPIATTKLPESKDKSDKYDFESIKPMPIPIKTQTKATTTMKSSRNTSSEYLKDVKVPYVGIANQGATCYMNSFLQALFHIPIFRNFIFSLPKDDNVIHNLQKFFACLQRADGTVSTQMLTKSFGWDRSEAFVQNDVQEFCRVLIDYIQDSIQNTDKKDGIKAIFGGKLKHVIECKKAGFRSEKEEDFLDISLEVEGISSLQESLDRFTKPESIQDYDTGAAGSQTVTLTTEFTQMPIVLQIQLMRFSFSAFTGAQNKISSAFVFPKIFTLNNAEYELFGVVIHAGRTVSSGHFYSYLKTDNKQWAEFNDSIVRAIREEAVFGDLLSGPLYNAYLLFYYRKDKADEIFANVDKSFVEKFKEEEVKEVISENEFTIITEDAMRINTMKGRTDLRCKEAKFTVQAPSSCSVKHLITLIANSMNIKENTIRLWQVEEYHIHGLIEYNASTDFIAPRTVFVQIKPEAEQYYNPYYNIIFIKAYSPYSDTPLLYCGTVCIHEDLTCTEIGMNALHINTSNIYVEDFNHNNILVKASSLTLNGDILYFVYNKDFDKSFVKECTKTRKQIKQDDELAFADVMEMEIPDTPDVFCAMRDNLVQVDVINLANEEEVTKLRVPREIEPKKLIQFYFLMTGLPDEPNKYSVFPQLTNCKAPQYHSIKTKAEFNKAINKAPFDPCFYLSSEFEDNIIQLQIFDYTDKIMNMYAEANNKSGIDDSDIIKYLEKRGISSETVSYVKNNEIESTSNDFDYIRVDVKKYKNPLKVTCISSNHSKNIGNPFIIDKREKSLDAIRKEIAEIIKENVSDVRFYKKDITTFKVFSEKDMKLGQIYVAVEKSKKSKDLAIHK